MASSLFPGESTPLISHPVQFHDAFRGLSPLGGLRPRGFVVHSLVV